MNRFPTLGFVVERWARIETFIPEDFWFLDMKITVNPNGSVAGLSQNDNDENNDTSNGSNQNYRSTSKPIFLKWKRERLYDRTLTLALYESCLDVGEAAVVSLTGRPKNKWRPVPLATVELQKKASRYLRIGSDTLMTIAEELYQQGLISYPRTETEKFHHEFQHIPLIQSFEGIGGEVGE
jgi:DNA topoisomerase-3